MRLVLITLGDPERLTGGYLYHKRMQELVPRHGATIDFASFPDWPFPLPILATRQVQRQARGADALLLDSLAAAFVGPWFWLSPPRVPVLGILHQPPGGIGYGPLRRTVQTLLDRLAYARTQRLLVASQWLTDWLATEGGYPRSKVQVLPPGRDVAEAAAEPPGDLRRGRRAAFLCVANWLPMKDLHSLLEAFAALPEDAGTLHLVGDEEADPAYAARLRQGIERLDGRVVTHGKLTRPQVAAMYAAADVFVLASLWETYGTVYGEAMAAGLPVVGWRTGNLPHLAEHGREGLALPIGDVPALTAALRRLADDEPYRARMAAAARAKAESFPTWDDTARNLVQEVRRALATR